MKIADDEPIARTRPRPDNAETGLSSRRPFRSWEDTVNIPAKREVRIAWLPDDRPGRWMYHCHILEHHAMGMMAHFELVP